MQKLSYKQKLRLIRRAKAQLIKRRRRKRNGRGHLHATEATSALKVIELKKQYPDVKIIYRNGFIELSAPEIMRLNQDEEKVMQFFNCMRRAVELPSRRTIVDFSTIKDLSPLCALLLASEVHRWQLLKKQKLKVHNSASWSPKIRKLLYDIGLFDLIDVSDAYIAEHVDTEEKFITLRSGQSVELERAVIRLEDEVSKIAILLNGNPQMYGGIEEAVTNVSQWAYTAFDQKTIQPEMRNRWWFFASYNTRTGRMTLMVYDHGGGIPNTVPTSTWFESIRGFLDRNGIAEWPDHEVIRAVMNLPRSSSGQQYRGKGLRKMRELLERFSKGGLKILSSHGEYNVDESGNESTKLHKYPIAGTLIVWEVYSNKEDKHD